MKDKRKVSYNLVMTILVFILTIIYAIYILLYKRNDSSFIIMIFNVIVLLLISFIAMFNQMRTKAKKKPLNLLNSLTVAVFACLSFFVINSTKTVAFEDTIPNFVGKNFTEAINWATENKVQLEQLYEYSDNYEQYIVFAQNVESGTKVSDINNLVLTISSGYNYDKKVILSSLVGQDVEAVNTEIERLHLNNVKISYKLDDYTPKNIIVAQSKSGEIRRNDLVEFTISLGKKEDLSDITMIDLTNYDLFDATLFLEQNGINYEIQHIFSNEKIGKITSQSIKSGTIVTPFDEKMVITVSKGSKIIVPDFKEMTINEIVSWISENNLSVSFSDEYDSKIPLGSIINSNYKKGDEIEEGTSVKIVTSKGALKMPKFASLNEFRTWASKYNIKYEEEYEFNTSIAKGSIIRFSLSENDLIDINDSIIVSISNGEAITIPNFLNKPKSEIEKTCKNINLNCTFTYTTYSSSALLNVAVAQNKKAGSAVVSGTNINISLSRGPAKTYQVNITESLLTIGNASKTISTLKTYFESKYPGVTFNFETKASNIYSNAGFIHESSQVTDGTNVTQGKTYKVIITK